jgi:GTPase SAR1 family protein
MEARDERLISQLIKENETLKEYMQQHQEYERQLEEFNKRIHLTTDEAVERKRIQKLKLANRDKIERILLEHRMAQRKGKAKKSRSRQ